jgi:hypothetical protein
VTQTESITWTTVDEPPDESLTVLISFDDHMAFPDDGQFDTPAVLQDWYAKQAVGYADALIAALDKEPDRD